MRYLICCFAVVLSFSLTNHGFAQGRNAQRLKQLDKNQDGNLSEQEAGKALWKRLSALDTNADGVLTKEELAKPRTEGNQGRKRPGGANNTFETKTFKGTNGESISYSLFSPKEVEGKIPLVLCLHGKGGNTTAANVAASQKIQAKNPCYVMAPACSGNAKWVLGGFRSSEGLRSVMPELLEAIAKLEETLPIDSNRIYITGQSMGGAGTWGTIVKNPHKFAAAVPVCGFWDAKDAEKIKDVPLWAFHGEKDSVVPVRGSRDMVAAMKEAGGKPKYTEYPGVNHSSWTQTYAKDELWDWLFQQSRKDEVKKD
ncbi:MAG: phospholipase [Blastopirellula sp.]|nr:MAG: phospholipase [Blastopirellula sp.]